MLVSSELNLTECLFMYETLSFSIKTKAITSFSDYKSRRSDPVIYEQLSFRVDELAKDKIVWSVWEKNEVAFKKDREELAKKGTN